MFDIRNIQVFNLRFMYGDKHNDDPLSMNIGRMFINIEMSTFSSTVTQTQGR